MCTYIYIYIVTNICLATHDWQATRHSTAVAKWHFFSAGVGPVPLLVSCLLKRSLTRHAFMSYVAAYSLPLPIQCYKGVGGRVKKQAGQPLGLSKGLPALITNNTTNTLVIHVCQKAGRHCLGKCKGCLAEQKIATNIQQTNQTATSKLVWLGCIPTHRSLTLDMHQHVSLSLDVRVKHNLRFNAFILKHLVTTCLHVLDVLAKHNLHTRAYIRKLGTTCIHVRDVCESNVRIQTSGPCMHSCAMCV